MKKKAKPPAKEASEEVVPVTMEEKLKAVLADTLKEAGVARTSAITLAGLDYADHLSDAIKKHYEDIETLYSTVQKTLKGKASEKELGQILKKVEDKAQATKKFQARFTQSPTCGVAIATAHRFTCRRVGIATGNRKIVTYMDTCTPTHIHINNILRDVTNICIYTYIYIYIYIYT